MELQRSPKKSDTVDAQDPLFLISWNVAGWASLVTNVEAHCDSLSSYLARMQCDIFCAQETKLQSSSLCPGVDSSRFAQAGGPEGTDSGPRYDGYWAFNLARPHSNGVVTWVKRGVSVLAATQKVLGVEALDREGRCLLTDHGSFVVFNVYAKSLSLSSEPAEVAKKLQFLQALEARMEACRALGRRVILAGDLNLTLRPEDTKLSRRLVHVSDDGAILGDGTASSDSKGVDDCEAVRDGEATALSEGKAAASGGLDSAGKLARWAGEWRCVADVAKLLKRPVSEFAGRTDLECAHWRSQPECVAWLRALCGPRARLLAPSAGPSEEAGGASGAGGALEICGDIYPRATLK